MPVPVSRKKRIIYFVLFALFFIIAIPALLLYATGYSFDETFNLSWRGGVYVYVAEPGVDVFIGNDLKRKTGLFAREVLAKNLRPGTYLVLAANEEYWPWAKFVEVEKGEVSSRFPLLVPKHVPFLEIKKGTAEYLETNRIFSTSTSITTSSTRATTSIIEKVPTSSTSTIQFITKRKTKIWMENNIIFAQWLGSIEARPYFFCVGYEKTNCPPKISVLEGVETIRKIDFYPGRDDAIILTLGDGIYASEIDPVTYHNFYPIFRGKSPDFRIVGDAIYIKDGEYVATAEI